MTEARRLLSADSPFAAHELCELRWKACPEAERDLWKGLAQLFAGYTHAARGNEVGAARLGRRAIRLLSAYAATGGPTYGLDLGDVTGEGVVVPGAREHAPPQG